MKPAFQSSGAVALAVVTLLSAAPPVIAQTGWGNALLLDGIDDHVQVTNFTAFPSSNITVEFWMRTSDPINSGTPFSYATPASANTFCILNYQDLVLAVAGQSVSTAISVNDGQWHHLAVTWRSADGALVLYRDGAGVFQTNLAVGDSLVAGGTMVIGQLQAGVGGGGLPGHAFQGELDEVRLWNVVRSPAEIDYWMGSSLTGKESGLVGYWRLNEGTGRTSRDSSSPGYDGSLLNGPVWVASAVPEFSPRFDSLLLRLTDLEPVSPQSLRLLFQDDGTGATNYLLEFRSELSPGSTWTNVPTAVGMTNLGNGLYEVEVTPSNGEQGFYRVAGLRRLTANFDFSETPSNEGSGTNYLTVVFDAPFQGTVHYTVSGTAGPGDYGALSGEVQVNGNTALIPISLNDNADIGQLKYVMLTLESGAGFELGANRQAMLTIDENDSRWHGGLQTDNGTVGFVLNVLQSGITFQTALTNDGFGFFPSLHLPAQASFTESSFSASVINIPMPAGSTMLNVPIDLTLTLAAVNGQPEESVSSTRVEGHATLIITVPDQPILDTTNFGTFILSRQAAAPSTNEVPFIVSEP